MGIFANLWRLARTGATFQRTGALAEAPATPNLKSAAPRNAGDVWMTIGTRKS